MGGSSCGQGWRGRNGRGSSGRLGRSGQQRGSGLAGAHWSMLNRGADEAGSKRQQVTWAPGLVGSEGVGGKDRLFGIQGRIQATAEGTPPQVLGKSSSPIPGAHDQIYGRGGAAWQHNPGGMSTPRFPVLPGRFFFLSKLQCRGKAHLGINQIPLLSCLPLSFRYSGKQTKAT